MNKFKFIKIMKIISLFIISIIILIILNTTIGSKFQSKPDLNVKINTTGVTKLIMIESKNCYITEAPVDTSILNADMYIYDETKTKNEKISVRLSSAQKNSKFYWGEINPYYLTHEYTPNLPLDIRCFSLDWDKTAIIGSKLTRVTVNSNGNVEVN
jgi:hypothetical protein